MLEREPKADSQGLKVAGDTIFYYGRLVTEEERQSLIMKIDTKELSLAKWIHYEELLQDPAVGEQYKLMIRNILHGRKDGEPFTLSIPDVHTLYSPERREEEAKNWHETMTMTPAVDKGMQTTID